MSMECCDKGDKKRFDYLKIKTKTKYSIHNAIKAVPENTIN